MIMKKLLAGAALAAVLLTTVSMSAEAGKIEDIQKAGVLKIGTTMDYVPMSYKDANGELKGFDIELGKKLAASLGVKAEFVKTTWSTLSQDTMDGKFDVAMSGITRNFKRQAQLDLSKGYLRYNGRTILCRKADAKKYTTWEKIDQKGVRIMNNPGGGNDRFATANVKNATRILHTPNNEIPEMVATGKADIMITEVVEALHYINADKRLAAPCVNNVFQGPNDFGILAKKGDLDFMRYLDFFIEATELDGSMKKLEKEL